MASDGEDPSKSTSSRSKKNMGNPGELIFDVNLMHEARQLARLNFATAEEFGPAFEPSPDELAKRMELMTLHNVTTLDELIGIRTLHYFNMWTRQKCFWRGCVEKYGEGQVLQFESKEACYLHIMYDHRVSDGGYSCCWKECKEKFDNRRHWAVHVCMEIDFYKYKCGICKRCFCSEYQYLPHLTAHEQNEWTKFYQKKEESEDLFNSPQDPTEVNTNSTTRFRKMMKRLRETGVVMAQPLCLHYSCDKFTASTIKDYCSYHEGRDDNRWILQAPIPLLREQVEGQRTTGDYFYRRELKSKYSGEWNQVCAYDTCFRPFNEKRSPFCSTTCKNEYLRRLSNYLNATALAGPSISSLQVKSVNKNQIILRNRLDPTPDETKKYIRHVKWSVKQVKDADGNSQLGFKALCIVEGCESVYSSHKMCNAHIKWLGEDHPIRQLNDQDPYFHMEKIHANVPNWTVGDWILTRELFVPSKIGTVNEWTRLCWNYECGESIGTKSLGFCGKLTCQTMAKSLPLLQSASGITRKRDRSKSVDMGSKRSK